MTSVIQCLQAPPPFLIHFFLPLSLFPPGLNLYHNYFLRDPLMANLAFNFFSQVFVSERKTGEDQKVSFLAYRDVFQPVTAHPRQQQMQRICSRGIKGK